MNSVSFTFPDYSRAERIADAIIHCIGVPLGLTAAEMIAVWRRIGLPAAGDGAKIYLQQCLQMELTLEQGGGRETQVQPLRPVWEMCWMA